MEDVRTMGDGFLRSKLFDCMWQDEALELRAASRMCRGAVAEHPWSDGGSRVCGSLSSWRACLPQARAATISAPRAQGC